MELYSDGDSSGNCERHQDRKFNTEAERLTSRTTDTRSQRNKNQQREQKPTETGNNQHRDRLEQFQ